ncbi:MAG TPA: carbonic anhydrase [Microbacterium sp.]|uniref:carbonic anhydrase n=1 Tax=Microbacterium sp. TaxID=51671 RepID=UPI002B4641E9|nr:carbonic anhydrase [Microbacterium sp.]HKT57428.1 carbonic anhydrase [Microbacterium sp.]
MTDVRPTPQQAWDEMRSGNDRFVSGAPHHPAQDVERRHELTTGQRPIAALFGCADSRLAAEIIFDKGLGDLFVIRNAGQVLSESVVGSIEYAVAILEVPLLVVLGHDACGAVRASIDSTRQDAPELPPHIWRLIAPIVPAVQRVMRADPDATPLNVDSELVGREHLRDTIDELMHSSDIVSRAVDEGRLAVVGANYRLEEGRADAHIIIGPVSDTEA